jgi:hypothetical protein
MRRGLAILLAIGAVALGVPACSGFTFRDCERGNFVGLIPPEDVSYPLTVKVGASIRVTSNYGTGKGNQGESCDRVLYTSLERPEQFQFFSTDPGVATISSTGTVTGIAPGQTVVYAIANGIVGRQETITVVSQ